jgi:hypothetical protein
MGKSALILFGSVLFCREPRAKSEKKGCRGQKAGKKGINSNSIRLLAGRLLAGFVAAFVISYTGILFKDVGLRFLS